MRRRPPAKPKQESCFFLRVRKARNNQIKLRFVPVFHGLTTFLKVLQISEAN